jgi:hypothetical protein
MFTTEMKEFASAFVRCRGCGQIIGATERAYTTHDLEQLREYVPQNSSQSIVALPAIKEQQAERLRPLIMAAQKFEHLIAIDSFPLPLQFQTELNLSRCCGGGSNDSRSGRGRGRSGREHDRVGRSEVGVIQDVEKLGA